MKENWIPIYRDKKKTRQAWACRDGSDLVVNSTHRGGPPNWAFNTSGRRQMVGLYSYEYRDNYDLINWNRNG